MRQILLAAMLIAVPVAIFFGVLHLQAPPPLPGLGDMSAFASIVTDVQAIAGRSPIWKPPGTMLKRPCGRSTRHNGARLMMPSTPA